MIGNKTNNGNEDFANTIVIYAAIQLLPALVAIVFYVTFIVTRMILSSL